MLFSYKFPFANMRYYMYKYALFRLSSQVMFAVVFRQVNGVSLKGIQRGTFATLLASRERLVLACPSSQESDTPSAILAQCLQLVAATSLGG
jgi:hypothetical protein